MRTTNSPRRKFLKQTIAGASAMAIPYHFSSSAALADDMASANDLPNLGLIGAGRMGFNHMRFAKGMCHVTAVCDVDQNHRANAHENLTGGKGKAYNDYRKIIDDQEIDVVYIATPDHWHAKILIEAMRAGKDAYCEKPLTLTVDEGKEIHRVQKETGRIVQVGTMQRSYLSLFVKAVAMAQEGRLGKISKITTTLNGSGGSGPLPVVEVPKWLDWNQWLGPAPETEFRWIPDRQRKPEDWNIGKTNAHQQFRWWYDYSGGKITDWGAHHVDIACWALRAAGQSDELLSIGGDAKMPCDYKDGYPVQNDRYNTTGDFSLTAKLKGETQLVINSAGDNGILIEGTEGRIMVNRGKLVGAPVERLKDDPLPEDAIAKAYRGMPTPFDQHKNHWSNFFHCTRERIEPISDVTSHLRAINICHLANIAARLGRQINWNDQQQRIVGDDQANEMLKREYRKGFEIEA